MKPKSRGGRDSVQEGNSMQSQATLPSQSDVWGILPLRFESELTAQKLEICRLCGLLEEFGPAGGNYTVSAKNRKSLRSSLESSCRRSLSPSVGGPWQARAKRSQTTVRVHHAIVS